MNADDEAYAFDDDGSFAEGDFDSYVSDEDYNEVWNTQGDYYTDDEPADLFLEEDVAVNAVSSVGSVVDPQATGEALADTGNVGSSAGEVKAESVAPTLPENFPHYNWRSSREIALERGEMARWSISKVGFYEPELRSRGIDPTPENLIARAMQEPWFVAKAEQFKKKHAKKIALREKIIEYFSLSDEQIALADEIADTPTPTSGSAGGVPYYVTQPPYNRPADQSLQQNRSKGMGLGYRYRPTGKW